MAFKTEIINLTLAAAGNPTALDLKGAKVSYWVVGANAVDIYVNESASGPFITIPVTTDLPFAMKSNDGYLYVRGNGGGATLQVMICRDNPGSSDY